ncbi:hypothetical protein Pcinc_028138 [Petrolisthes cinctipes]|uniref:Uncharacterized protein n=1 Tax=Petrolisthes cinctipes TaxID=88211 RepID=A0AAE1F2I1_PETCI|nr:hypothetical protein Pcinc_028138 [Petrolisthes cinctipes]
MLKGGTRNASAGVVSQGECLMSGPCSLLSRKFYTSTENPLRTITSIEFQSYRSDDTLSTLNLHPLTACRPKYKPATKGLPELRIGGRLKDGVGSIPIVTFSITPNNTIQHPFISQTSISRESGCIWDYLRPSADKSPRKEGSRKRRRSRNGETEHWERKAND